MRVFWEWLRRHKDDINTVCALLNVVLALASFLWMVTH